MDVAHHARAWARNTTEFMRESGRELGDLINALSCAGCGGYGVRLCDECWLQWQVGAMRAEDEVSALQLRSNFPLWAAAPYEGAVRQTIVALKDRGRLDVIDVVSGAAMRLAQRIAPTLEECVPKQLLPIHVVPTPPRKPVWLSGREIDLPTHFAHELVAYLRRFEVEARADNVLRTRGWSREQVGLDRAARRKNRRRSMRIRSGGTDLEGRAILVVDDVATTGATMTEAVRELTRAGGAVLGGAVLAVTVLRNGRSESVR